MGGVGWGWGPRLNPEPDRTPTNFGSYLASRAPAAAVPASCRRGLRRRPPDQPSAVAPPCPAPPSGQAPLCRLVAGPTWRGMVRDTIAPGRQVCVRAWGCPAPPPPPVPGTVFPYCCLPARCSHAEGREGAGLAGVQLLEGGRRRCW